MNRRHLLLSSSSLLLGGSALPFPLQAAADPHSTAIDTGEFQWVSSGPLIDVGPGREAADPHVAIKDPSIVFHEGQWHLFATLRMKSGRVCMEYLNFADWQHANEAPRALLELHDAYHCAPQVFWFTPEKRWYLIYQCRFVGKKPGLWPCFSTTENIADPKSWTKPQPMIPHAPEDRKWIDFWVICDEEKAHLFYTSDDGHFWRVETKRADFPLGWSETPQLCLKEDIFEASHTYKLKGRKEYLTIIEAQAPGRRYYKAYVADALDGAWRPLAATLQKPFAAKENVHQDPEWATSISHGEMIRNGVDETMELDPDHLRFLFQGVDDKGYKAAGYGAIPWRLGLMELKK